MRLSCEGHATCGVSGEGHAQAVAALPQRRVCLLLWQPDGAGGDAQAVQHQTQASQCRNAVLDRKIASSRHKMNYLASFIDLSQCVYSFAVMHVQVGFSLILLQRYLNCAQIEFIASW